jgi:hypothetical protein
MGADGFTTLHKEGLLRIYFDLKIHLFRPGLNPQAFGPVAVKITIKPPRAACLTISNNDKFYFQSKFVLHILAMILTVFVVFLILYIKIKKNGSYYYYYYY